MKKFTFIILCLEGALLSFNVAAAAALIPSVAKEFALSQFSVGAIVWSYMVTYGLAALLYGPLVRKFDARTVELICIILFSFANLIVGFAKGFLVLLSGRLLMGFFGASVIPLGLILIARHKAQEERGKYIGTFFGLTFIASLLGLFLSGVIYWRFIFLIPGTLGFILWALMYFCLPSFKEDMGVFEFNYFSIFKDKGIVRILSYIFLISLIYHAIQQWLGVYFSTQIGLDQFKISMLITLTALSGIFGEIWGGLLADSLGRKKIINWGILLMIFSIIFLVLKPPLWFLALTMIIWGLGWTFNHVGLATMLTDLPPDALNEAASLNSSIRFISGGLGMSLGGFIMSKSFNLGFVVFGCGLFFLLSRGKLTKIK